MRRLLPLLFSLLLVHVAPAHAGTIEDLGTHQAFAVGGGEVVLDDDSVLVDGVVRTPEAPAGGSPFHAQGVSETGVVAGFAGSQAAYWDVRHSNTYATVSTSGVPVDGVGSKFSSLGTIDAAGEASGTAYRNTADGGRNYVGFSVPAVGGVPAGAAHPDADNPLSPTLAWRYVRSNGNSEAQLVNRASGTATPTGLISVEPFGVSFASDGTAVGWSAAQGKAAIRLPDGTTNVLDGNVGTTVQVESRGVNADHVVVGDAKHYDATPGTPSLVGATWDADGTMTPLLDQVTDGAGWSNLHPYDIDDAGEIVGTGTLNGALHGFRITLSQPDLTAAVSATSADGGPLTGQATAVGQTVKVHVVLAASSAAKTAIDHVRVDPPLTASPDGTLSLVGGPTPAAPTGATTLAPGEQTTYDLTYKVVRAGKVTLALTATGYEDGTPVSADGSLDVQLGQPLQVTVGWEQDGHPIAVGDLQDAVKLADDDKGEVPQQLTAKVRIENVSAKAQENVSVDGTPAFSYHDPADARQLLPVAVTGGPTPAAIPTLAPGDVKTVSCPVTVSQNGRFDLSTLVLSSSVGEDATNRSTGTGTLTALPTALLWLKVQKGSEDVVTPGVPVPLVGTITNRSNTQALDVDPLEPSASEAVGGGGLHDIQQGPLADGVQLPFVGRLDPGQSITLSGVAQTARIRGTRAELSYAPSGAIIVDDTHETALGADQVGMTSGSSPVHISIDQRDPPVPPVTAQTLYDSMTDAAMLGTTEWMYNRTTAAAAFLSHPFTGAYGVTRDMASFAYSASADVFDAASLGVSIYAVSTAAIGMTEQQRAAFGRQIADDFAASHLGADHAKLSAAADSVLPTFFSAYQTGDWNKVVAMGTTGATFGLTTAADAMLSDIAFQKLALGFKTGASKAAGVGDLANAIKLGDALREHGVSPVLGKGIEAAKPGVNLLADNARVLKNDFGLTSKQITELINYCKRTKVIVAMRSRSKRAADLIKRGLAVAKNEVIKLKGVNEVDVDYLGYNRDHLNTVVWAEPISEGAVAAKVARLDPEMRAVVQERYATRVKEWHDKKIRAVLSEGEKTGKIDWGFNGTDNGAGGANRSGKRTFELRDAKNPKGHAGRTYQQVLVGNKTGLAKGIRRVPITQDVDLMAILGSDGRILSAAERTAAYLHLQDLLDIQHPETPTWLADGEIMFKAKAKQLADVLRGGEPLAVFNPAGGATAGFFDPHLTIFDTATKGGRIFFDGGYNDPFAHWKLSLVLRLRDIGLFSYKTLPGGGLTVFMDLEPGTVTTTATQDTPAGKASAARKALLVARATKRVRHRGQVRLVLRPNKAGRRILRRKHHLRVTVTTTFRPAGKKTAQRTSKAYTLRRKRSHH